MLPAAVAGAGGARGARSDWRSGTGARSAGNSRERSDSAAAEGEGTL